jgi:hypothetical protein
MILFGGFTKTLTKTKERPRICAEETDLRTGNGKELGLSRVVMG